MKYAPVVYETNRKIDFHAGSHGNFLELLLHALSFPEEIDLNSPQFDDYGACHLRWNSEYNRTYFPKIGVAHYSSHCIPFNPDDRVIEIHVDYDHWITVGINCFLRAGDQHVDIYHPEIDSLKKFSGMPKMQDWVDMLLRQHGTQKNYPRSIFRKFWYNMYAYDVKRIFSFTGKKMIFPHSNFFNFDQLNLYIDKSLDFFGLPKKMGPNDKTLKSVWEEFIEMNQGLKSKIRCDEILGSIKRNEIASLENLSVPEEAWIIFKLYPIFNDLVFDLLNNFPTDTKSMIASR